MARIKRLDEMAGGKNGFAITIECEDYILADALREIADRIDNDDILDGIAGGKATVDNGGDYTASIERI